MGKEALKDALAEGSPVWLPWLTVALALSSVATTLLMARFGALLWLNPPKAPAARPEALALPFIALSGGAVALPLILPLLDGRLAAPVVAASEGALWPVALGLGIALAVAINAYAQRIGPAHFVAELMAPGHMLAHRVSTLWAGKRRAARRFGMALPRRLEDHAQRWRLAQTAIAALIAAVMLIELAAGSYLEGLPQVDGALPGY